MLRGIFVTGSDTGVGKTVVSAAVMQRLRPRVERICYWKPFQTGFPADSDTLTVRELGSCADLEIVDVGVRLSAPFAPLFAARLENRSVTIDETLDLLSRNNESSNIKSNETVWIVEGAGGLLVPINEKEMMIDLITRLEMTAVIATRSTLGTINHTLLTLEALHNRNIPIAGVVMVGDTSPDNREAIEKFGEVRVLGNMPFFEKLNPESVASWAMSEFDVNDHLLEMF